MTLEELYLKEQGRIKRLALHYAKMFQIAQEDLFQEGMLALAEVYRNYAYKLMDDELVKIANKIINRKMYKYAKNEYKYIASIHW